MDGTSVVLILVFITSITYLFTLRGRSKKTGKQIPGPSLFTGLREFLDAANNYKLHRLAGRWAQQFGEMCSVNLVARKIVFINNVDLFRKLVNDPVSKNLTNDRPPTFFLKMVLKKDFDLGFGNHGPEHTRARKLFHKALMFYGEGVKTFEDVMANALSDFKRFLRENRENNIELNDEFSRFILGIVAVLLTGFKSASEEEMKTIKDLDEAVNDILLFENEAFLQPFPCLRLVPGLRFKKLFDRVKPCKKRFDNLFFERLKDSYIPGEERGIVDQFLKVTELGPETTSSVQMSLDTASNYVMDTAGASYLTTTKSLQSLFLILITYPHLQDKIHQEICQVVGRNEHLSFSDRARMPFTEAVILESFRYYSAVPFLLPHICREDVEIDGYFIEKGTTLMANVWHFHHDANKWEQPWEFRPERFLDADGQLLDARHPQRQKLLPFGSGPRSCPGESFARSRIFLVTVSLLQEFMFLPVASAPLPSHDPRDHVQKLVIAPDNYICTVKLRE